MGLSAATTTISEKEQGRVARKVLTGKFRVSFPQVFEPKAFQEGKPKYSLVMLFSKKEYPKKSDLVGIQKAAAVAMEEKFGSRDKWPKKFRTPVRDGDEEKPDTDGYKGHWFISASSIDKPSVIDSLFITGPDGKPTGDVITKEDKRFYAGCYARATIQAFGYDQKGNKGVSFGLLNVQKLADGKGFSARSSAEADFTSVESVDSSDDGSVRSDDSSSGEESSDDGF